MRTTDLVQRLQVARRELGLEAAITKLDKYQLLILHDIAYVTKDQAETGVLFELPSAMNADPCSSRPTSPSANGARFSPSRRFHDASFFERLVCRAWVRSRLICSSVRSICHGWPFVSCRPDNNPRSR
jgi:hypothetical protein